MPDGPSDLASDLAPVAGGADGAARARIEALIAAARDLSDTCADLADELRPDPGTDGFPLAERAAALLDEAASAVRGTLAMLGAAVAALQEPPAPDEPEEPAAHQEPHPTEAIPAQVALDPFTGPSPWSRTAIPPDPTPEPIRAGLPDGVDTGAHAAGPTDEDRPAGTEAAVRSGSAPEAADPVEAAPEPAWPERPAPVDEAPPVEEPAVAAWPAQPGDALEPEGAAWPERPGFVDEDVADVLPAPRAVATTWPDAFREAPARAVPEDDPEEDLVAAARLDDHDGAAIGAYLDREDGDGLAAVPAALAGWVVVDPDETGGEPVALEHRPTGPLPAIPVAAAAAAGPTMLTVSTDDDPYADAEPYGDAASTEPRSLTLVPPLPPTEPTGPTEPAEPDDDPVSELPPPVEVPEPPLWTPEEPAWTTADTPAWTTADAPAWPATDEWPGRSVWSVEPVPGASPAGDGLPAYPLDEPHDSDDGQQQLPITPAEAALPAEPVDAPAAAVVARQVEAARRHLQAALAVANTETRLGALLTAVEQALTAVTDLARETRGVLPELLADRTFPGEARFLCSNPWETVAIVGPGAYGDEPVNPAGLAKLLRALGYDAESVTSASGVSGVQVRSDRYAAHVALVEPAGGGRQRWSGALEWADESGASRTWAETLGPVELPEDELARRVDELLRRSLNG